MAKREAVPAHITVFWGRVALTITLILVAVSATSLFFLHQNISQRVKRSITLVLDNTYNSLQRWENQQQSELSFWARSPELHEQLKQLNQSWQRNKALDSPLQTTLHKQLQSLYKDGEHEGYYLLSPEGVILSADQRQLWGNVHPLWLDPSARTPLSKGQVILGIQKVQQPGFASGLHLFSATAITNQQGQVSGILVVKLNLGHQLIPLLERTRYLSTGQNYLFDGSGQKLVPQLGQHIPLPLHPEHSQPHQIQSYPMPNGTVMWRIWVWDPRLQIGLATEVERREALQVYDFIQILMGLFTLLAIGLLLGLSFVYHLSYRRAQTLQAYTAQERDRARRFLEAAANFMVVLDFNGQIQQINRQARTFLGSQAPVIGKSLSQFLIPHEQQQFRTILEQLRSGEVATIEGEYQLTTPFGETHYLVWSIAPLETNNVQSGYIISGQDISLRRKAEQALQALNQELEQRVEERTRELRNSESMFRAITLGAQDGIVLLDPAQKVVLANEAAEDILGYPQETLLNSSFFALLADENTVLSCERDEPQQLHEVWVKHQQGHIFPIEMTLSPFCFQEEDYMVAILRDISERKQMADALAKANLQLAEQVEKLQELIGEKSEFLGIASHDLKNPLGVVAGVGRLLQRKAAHLKPEEAQQYGEMVQRSAEKMLAIVINLLDVQRLEEGQVHLQIAPFQIYTLVAEIAATHSHGLTQKGQQIVIEIPPEQCLHSDRQMVGQILENLISNSMKYAPTHTVITVRSSGNNPVEIQIRDQGPGFSTADRSRLFQKFARLSARPTGGEHSTGLGLAIVKRLTQLLGGEITLSDEVTSGACFILTLPNPINKA